jgi:hypothetical protein
MCCLHCILILFDVCSWWGVLDITLCVCQSLSNKRRKDSLQLLRLSPSVSTKSLACMSASTKLQASCIRQRSYISEYKLSNYINYSISKFWSVDLYMRWHQNVTFFCPVFKFLQYVKNLSIVLQKPCQSVYSRSPLVSANNLTLFLVENMLLLVVWHWFSTGRFNFDFIMFFLLLEPLINHFYIYIIRCSVNRDDYASAWTGHIFTINQ